MENPARTVRPLPRSCIKAHFGLQTIEVESSKVMTLLMEGAMYSRVDLAVSNSAWKQRNHSINGDALQYRVLYSDTYQIAQATYGRNADGKGERDSS